MVGHDNIAEDAKAIPAANTLQNLLKDIPGGGSFQILFAMVASESDEMKLLAMLIALQSRWHGGEIYTGLLERATDFVPHPSPKSGERVGHPKRASSILLFVVRPQHLPRRAHRR
jgi:hypothetical protein